MRMGKKQKQKRTSITQNRAANARIDQLKRKTCQWAKRLFAPNVCTRENNPPLGHNVKMRTTYLYCAQI